MQFSSESGWPRPGQLQETIPTPVNKTGSWRFLTPLRRENNSPCRLLCPLENGIPRWMNKIREGDWQGAWQIMQEYNPFPAITGYVCYRFCQEKCHRGLWDEPVAIREVEKAIGLWRHKNYRPGGTGLNGRGKMLESKKVAIVGSGPAGLSCAYYLQQQGAAVTVFEKMPLAGGLLPRVFRICLPERLKSWKFWRQRVLFSRPAWRWAGMSACRSYRINLTPFCLLSAHSKAGGCGSREKSCPVLPGLWKFYGIFTWGGGKRLRGVWLLSVVATRLWMPPVGQAAGARQPSLAFRRDARSPDEIKLLQKPG